MTDERAVLTRLWWAGVNAVKGEQAVAASLGAAPIPAPTAIAAVGKAAAAMAQPAMERFPGTPTLVVTKYNHAPEMPGAEVIESAHPVPDAESLRAGARLLDFVSSQPSGVHLLLLVSGGASALVEVPTPGLTLDDLISENSRLLAAGLDIAAMNTRRRELSQVKGGGLLGAFRGARVTVLAISDVEGDSLGVIGSGIGLVPEGVGYAHDSRIVGSNANAREAVAKAAEAEGLAVLSSDETLYSDYKEAADTIASGLSGQTGLRIWGGEPTVVLPPDPGEGGRNQALALALAQKVAGRDGVTALVAGTDGSDGPTLAAGGIVDGQTWTTEGAKYLDRADAGTFLEQRDALFTTGPTGTNVMDLALVLQR
ncbi:MAG: DUF4147 domain-containing protein [Pseudomonadota bacterium]